MADEEKSDPPKEKKTRRKPVPPPPPKGNKYALGNKGGHPKVWDPKKEAKELLKWAEKPNSIIITDFSLERGFSQQRCSEWEKSCPEFGEAYTTAKQIIANRRQKLALAGKIKEGVYNRYQAMYDSSLHRFEREEKAYQASLNNNNSTGDNVNLFQLLQLFSEGKISAEDMTKIIPPGSLSQKNDESD